MDFSRSDTGSKLRISPSELDENGGCLVGQENYFATLETWQTSADNDITCQGKGTTAVQRQ